MNSRALSGHDVSDLFELFGVYSADTYRLGLAISAWPYIPFNVLRKCRQILDPQIATYIEGELCWSSLADACAADGFSLERSFRIEALQRLRSICREASSELKVELAFLRSRLEPHYDEISPLLAIEAEIAWNYVLLAEADFLSEVERRLRDILGTAVNEQRVGVLGWFAAARARLPEDCLQGETAWLLSQLCRVHKLELAPVLAPANFSATGLIRLALDSLPTTVVGMERSRGAIEFGPPSATRCVGLTVVDSDPLIFNMKESQASGATLVREIHISRGQEKKVPCGDGEIVLENLLGQSFTLRKFEGERSVEAKAAMHAISRAEIAKDRKLPFTATVIRAIEAGYVVNIDEVGATALMLSPGKELHEGDKLIVKIDRVFRDKRWISAKPVFYAPEVWKDERSAILHIPIEAVPRSVHPGDVFPATIIKHGKVVAGGRRSAHVYIDPRCLLGGIYFDHRPGHLRFGQAVRRSGANWLPEIGAKMEILASGVVGSFWQFRLSPCRNPADRDTQAEMVVSRKQITASIIAVHHHGVDLEAPNGRRLWMPRSEVFPLPEAKEAIDLSVGDNIEVRVLRIWEHKPDRFIVSQRALVEPYIDRMLLNTEVVGVIRRRLPDNEFIVLLDPIEGVSRTHFWVRTCYCAHLRLDVDMRVVGKVSRLIVGNWLRLISDVRPLGDNALTS